ncbi:hypothetical protein [Bradyrhizobium sp. USDA 3650]
MCIHLSEFEAAIIAELPRLWRRRFASELKRLCLLSALVGGLTGAAEAQTSLQLRPHSAWDGLGPDPDAAQSVSRFTTERRSATQKSKGPLNSAGEQPPSVASPDRSRRPDSFEESVEQDQENRQLKRATEICKRC